MEEGGFRDQTLYARDLLKHDLPPSEKKTITHLSVLDGLVVAAGHSKGAKKRKERDGMLSQIVPSIFVLTARIDSGSSSAPPSPDDDPPPPSPSTSPPAWRSGMRSVGSLNLKHPP